jgi:hypothetical protein
MTELDDFVKLVHDLKDAQTVNHVNNNLLKKAMEINTRQAETIKLLYSRIDTLISKPEGNT